MSDSLEAFSACQDRVTAVVIADSGLAGGRYTYRNFRIAIHVSDEFDLSAISEDDARSIARALNSAATVVEHRQRDHS